MGLRRDFLPLLPHEKEVYQEEHLLRIVFDAEGILDVFRGRIYTFIGKYIYRGRKSHV